MPTIHDAQLLSLLDDGWILTFLKDHQAGLTHLTGCHQTTGRQVTASGDSHMKAISNFCKYISEKRIYNPMLPSTEKELTNG